MKQYEVIGVIITLLGAVLWGVSGASVQFLSNFRDMNLEWLVTMRLITAGLLTIIYAWFRFGNSIFNVFHSVKDTLGLIVFGVFGMPIYILQIHCFSWSWHCNGITISGAVYDYYLPAGSLW